MNEPSVEVTELKLSQDVPPTCGQLFGASRSSQALKELTEIVGSPLIPLKRTKIGCC